MEFLLLKETEPLEFFCFFNYYPQMPSLDFAGNPSSSLQNKTLLFRSPLSHAILLLLME